MKINRLYIGVIIACLTAGTAAAQVKKPVTKPAAQSTAKKTVTKTSIAPAAKKPATAAQNKTAAQKLGEAAAAAPRDTFKKGQAANSSPDINSTSLSEEIIVTTAYKPVLADAVKIRRNPDLSDKTPFKAPLAYKTVDKRLERNTDIKQMEAAKLPPEKDSVAYNNLIRGGLGSVKTTFGELYINNGKDDALQAGAYIKHFAQAGDSYPRQNQSKDEFSVFGKSIGPVNSLHGSIGYSRRGNNFYGYDNLAPPPAVLDNAGQYFNTLSAEGELTKNFRDVENDFTYALKANGYLFSNAYHARENTLAISGFINQNVKQFYAGLNGSAEISTEKDNLYNISNNLVRANPYLKFQGDNYKVDAGINLVSEIGFSTRFFVFPSARLELQVVPKYLRLFAEAKGDVNRSSLQGFSEINPFLGENIAIKNSVDQLDLAAGLKGTLAPGLGFKASVYRDQVKNLPLMVSNFNFAAGYNRFMVIYDGGNARITGFNGELDYRASEDLDIFGHVEIKDYKLATEAQPWNLPKFKLTAGANIRISNKISLNSSLLFRGSTYERVADPLNPGQTQVVSLSSFADINAGAEYHVNRRISIFAKVNNLINANYSTWLYYPDYYFNIYGGLSYAF